MSVEVDIVPSLDRFEAALARMPEIGAEQAKALVKAVDRELQGIAKSADKHARAAAKAQEEAFDAAKTKFEKSSLFMKEVAGQMAPALAPVADIVEGLGGNFLDLAEAMGPVGVAAGATAVALVAIPASLAGVVAGTKAMADSAVEADARLRALGLTGELNAVTAGQYADSQKRLGVEVDRLKVAVGERFMPALTELINVTTLVINKSEGWIDTLETIHGWTKAISPVYWAYRSAMDGAREESDALAQSLDRQIEAGRELRDTYGDLLDTGFVGPIKTWNDEVPKAAKATKSWEAALLDVLNAHSKVGKDTLAGIPTAADIQAQLDYASLSVPVQVEVIGSPVVQQQLVGLSDAVSATTESAVGGMQAFKDAAEQAGAAIANAQAVTEPWGDAVAGISELMSMGAEEAKGRLDEIVKANNKANKALQRADNSTARARLAALADFGKASEDAARKEYDSKKAQALKAFQAEKGGKLLSIGMSTAAAIMQAYAMLGPIAGTAAGVGITIAGAAQAAIVAKTKPPTFHTGGMPMAADEMDIRAKRGEAVVSQRDYGRLLDTLDRLDQHLGASSGVEANVLVQIDGKHIPGRATVKSGRRNPFAGRR